jgi:uncharacterized damage-inducible protein DinB
VALVDALLPEFDREMTTTRKLIERVPQDKLDWKPHARSFSLGSLATHVANLPMWGEITLIKSELDPGAEPPASVPDSTAGLLAMFDARVASTRSALAGRTDAEFAAPWTLKRGTETIFTMPKSAVWRFFVLNHIVHHRGQLSVYLRLLDVPVPSMYGPSADEAAPR